MSGGRVDPRTPVLVGVGQISDAIDRPGYRQLSPVGLAVAAGRSALIDTGADQTALAAAIDTVAGVRQFEISLPGAVALLGRSDNYPRSVATRIGARPERAILEVVGGQAPQHLVTELAGRIAAGRSTVALLFGSEAISTARHFAGTSNKPDFTEAIGGDLEDRGYGLDGILSAYLGRHGVIDAPSHYALFENARRARLGLNRQTYAMEQMGSLLAPFSAVAAENPYAAAPTERSAVELVTPTAANRLIADPYPRYLVARDQVNQGAAVLLMSLQAARRLGVDPERWIFLHGHADVRERDVLDRADLSRSPASVAAARIALQVAGIGSSSLAALDLYSCFPIAVSTICDGLDLQADDPRGLTVTGGLPFFGGPGNNYSMHAIAEMVVRLRKLPGAHGFVGAVGGMLSKYSAAVYSTTPTNWRMGHSAELQRSVDGEPAVPHVEHADGAATIESYTVIFDRRGNRTGTVIGRLDAAGQRFAAVVPPGDTEFLDLLSAGEPIGTAFSVRPGKMTNVATLDRR